MIPVAAVCKLISVLLAAGFALTFLVLFVWLAGAIAMTLVSSIKSFVKGRKSIENKSNRSSFDSTDSDTDWVRYDRTR
jgi:hypothetical protein